MPNLFISGVHPWPHCRELTDRHAPHRLLSLHQSYLNLAKKWFTQIGEIRDTSDMELMLDSGAFTAWSRKESELDVHSLLRTYRQIQKSYGDRFKAVYFISLDKIPGEPGRAPTHEEISNAIRISDKNHHVLKSELGDSVLPVFHQSEPGERLHEVVSLNPTYICAAPRNDAKENVRVNWSHRIHAAIPGVWTHGLATTGGTMMLEVPWRSVDSAAWALRAAYGLIFVPVGNSIQSFAISEHSPNRRRWGQHIENMGPQLMAKVEQLREELGVSYEDLRTKPGARGAFNVFTLAKIAAVPLRKTPVPGGLFAL